MSDLSHANASQDVARTATDSAPATLELDVRLRRGGFELAVRESLALAGITAVFGASGSGKTSLLRVIAGLEPRASGSIRFREREWMSEAVRLRPEDRAVGYVFQDGRLFPHLDVRGNLLFPSRHGRRSGPIDFDSAVDAFDLKVLLARHPASLSGGERQRVAIARALLAAPGLLLMDEPLSSLDRARKRELLPLLRSLPDRYGIPILYVTHDIDELAQLADDVMLLANGRNIALGSPRAIVERGDFERLTALDDAGTILEARVVAHAERLTLASLAGMSLSIPRIGARTGSVVRLRISPRDVILATDPPQRISIRNRLEGRIRTIEARDDGQCVVVIAIGEQLLKARITQEAVADLGLAVDGSVYALIKAVALAPYGAA